MRAPYLHFFKIRYDYDPSVAQAQAKNASLALLSEGEDYVHLIHAVEPRPP